MKRTMLFLSVVFYALSCRMVNISNDLLEVRTEEHNLQRNGTIIFNNTNGDLKLTEWTSDFIQVETSIYGDSSRGIPEDLRILVEKLDDELVYSVDYPGGLSFVSVDFDVKVPAGSEYNLISTTVNGETEINARLHALIESVNGDIYINALSSKGISTVNGDILAVLDEQMESFVIETVNGDLNLEIPNDLGIEIDTLNGDITIDGQVYQTGASIRGTSEAKATVETVNGDIEVKRLN